jgi:hypothetical protein
MSMHMSRTIFATLLALLASGAAMAAPADPPVPPGRDPGGVAVAIIGPGVDYTQPDIAARLARDGEGEIIGWDFVDNDRRPFEKGSILGPAFDQNRICHRLAIEAASSRFEFFRTNPALEEAQFRLRLVPAFGMAVQSPAQIVLLLDWASPLLEEASKSFPDRLFIVPATEIPPLGLKGTSLPRYSNVLFSGGVNAACEQSGSDAEIATPTDCLSVNMLDSHVAATRIAALAARLKAAEPNITAAEMKQRILSLATPLPDGPNGPRPYGLIADPMSHFPAK